MSGPTGGADVLERLRGGLVVSSQVMNPESPLGEPRTLAALAHAAVLGGAVGARVAGCDVVRAVRAVLPDLPVIGITKQRRDGYDTYITASVAEAVSLVDAGADVVAGQATASSRPAEPFAEIVHAVHARGARVMADVSSVAEAIAAVEDGADLVATTMVGFTPTSRGASRPPVDLTQELTAALRVPVVVEGGVWTPDHVAGAFAAGAHAVVVGAAVTAPDRIVARLLTGAPASALPV